MSQILSALECLHSKQIMHRDIKPENLVFRSKSPTSDIILVDFGLSEFATKSNYNFTRCGTPGYVAPEILNDKKYDCKVDIFSLGIILYTLLCGENPFNSNDYNKVVKKNKECFLDFSYFQKHSDASSEAYNLLIGMLQKNPSERYSATQCLEHVWFTKFLNNQPESVDEYDDYIPGTVSENISKLAKQKINFKLMKPFKEQINKEIFMQSPIITGQKKKLTENYVFQSPTNQKKRTKEIKKVPSNLLQNIYGSAKSQETQELLSQQDSKNLESYLKAKQTTELLNKYFYQQN